MPGTMKDDNKILDANQVMNQNQAALQNFSINWLLDFKDVAHVKDLKEIALGNCRLLYGSERFKFYDIVIAEDEKNGAFCAVLTCNQNGATKLLRKEISHCPVKAVSTMVEGLSKDTTLLFTKYDIGSQIRGEQGFTNERTGKFELATSPRDERYEGPDDDTRGLGSYGPPRAPRADGGGFKRARMDSGLPYDG